MILDLQGPGPALPALLENVIPTDRARHCNMAGAGGALNMDSATAQVKRLINTQLKQVCKGAGLPVSGAKAALQSRIISRTFYSHY